MIHVAPSLEDLPLDLVHKIDDLCVRFERAWCSSAAPSLDAYVGELPGLGREALFEELLALELEYRRLRGETLTFEHYAARYPDQLDILRNAWSAPRGETTRRVKDNVPLPQAFPPDSSDAGPRRFGDYLLVRKLGQGGMGVVYEARQLSLNRTVALKMIRAGEFADAEERLRFQNEVETVSRLDHPGIVPIMEVGAVGDQRYYSMKLVAGGNLAEQLGRYTGDFKATALLMIGVAEAVHHAHQRGVLHRDLKPANILIDADGRPHVSDFGLAKWSGKEGTITVSGEIMGSPAYMAPEQASGDRAAITTATDVYGLGAVLYTVLAGRPPFVGESVLDTLDQVRDRVPDSATKSNPRVPRDLDLICRTCLEKDPRRRYSSAIALAEDLGRWLAGRPIAARRVGVITRSWMWCKRRPGLAALTAALIVALAGGFFGVASQWRRAQNNFQLASRANADLKTANTGLRRTQAVLRRTLYAAHMNLVQNAWESNSIGRVRDLLDQARPAPDEFDRRGFEWYYWQRLSQTELHTFKGLETDLAPVTFSPDGRWVAAADKLGLIKAWDCVTGKEVLSIKAHPAAIRSLAFSPSGKQIVSAGLDHRAKIWDVATRALKLEFAGHGGPITCAAYSPDGLRIVTSSWDKTAKVWDAASGKVWLTLEGHSARLRAVAFSPDGRKIATGSFDHTIKIWDASRGANLYTLKGHTDVVGGLAFSADSRRLASASNDRTIRVWDVPTGALELTLKGHTNWVHGVAFSPDGRRLASAGWDRTVRLWDAVKGDELLSFKGHTDNVMSVAFNPDGRRVASCSSDNTVKVWESLANGETQVLRDHGEKVRDLAFSADGSRLVSVDDAGAVYVWDAESGREAILPFKVSPAIHSVSFGPDGRFAFDSGGLVQVRDSSTGRELLKFGKGAAPISRVASRPDGQRIACAQGKDIKIWDPNEATIVRELTGHSDLIASLAYSPDGTRIVSADEVGHLKIWDADNGRALHSIGNPTPVAELHAVAFSPSGRRIATAGRDGMARVIDAESGRELVVLKGHIGAVYDVAFSPDGRRIATCARDQTVKLWDAVTGSEVLTLKGHTSSVVAVSFSPDGRRIASGSGDRTVRIWDAGPQTTRPAEVVDPLESP